jgi:hypothetical protein
LWKVAAMLESLDSLAQFSDRLNCKKDVLLGSSQQARHTGICPLAFAQFANDVGIDQEHD